MALDRAFFASTAFSLRCARRRRRSLQAPWTNRWKRAALSSPPSTTAPASCASSTSRPSSWPSSATLQPQLQHVLAARGADDGALSFSACARCSCVMRGAPRTADALAASTRQAAACATPPTRCSSRRSTSGTRRSTTSSAGSPPAPRTPPTASPTARPPPRSPTTRPPSPSARATGPRRRPQGGDTFEVAARQRARRRRGRRQRRRHVLGDVHGDGDRNVRAPRDARPKAHPRSAAAAQFGAAQFGARV